MIYALVQGVSRLSTFREIFGRQIGVTPSQFAVLLSVAHCQGRSGVAIRSLADHAAMAATHVTTEVGRLSRKGLVKKKPSPTDGRSVLVLLTSKGEAAIDGLVPFMRGVNDTLFKDLDAATMTIVYAFSKRLLINAEAAMAEVCKRELEDEMDQTRAALRRSPAAQDVVQAKRRLQRRLQRRL
ncbi:MAG: MarR family winged helix-turn-helix transcriptional regulator [Beijerinckiaceae bacterium]|nr:MarR family winged helix-turn-helix transcriptional regulator [Beijerinckiaceae bacterium]